MVGSLILSLLASSARAAVPAEEAPPAPRVALSSAVPAAVQAAPVVYPEGEVPMRAIHVTAWAAGSPKGRRDLLERMRGTVLNAVVVPVKEIEGEVYIPGVPSAAAYGTYAPAIARPEPMLADFKAAGYKVVARVVVFKDDKLPRSRPELGIRTPEGGLWTNAKGVAWVDPYRREVWDYNIEVASRAAALGFDEVQFDYIRFPSDGDTRQCRYSRADHSSATAVANLVAFLEEARRRLPGVPLSAAVFGMTTTAKDDMGIGQRLDRLARMIEAVSPMMYPSHYGKGEYGLADPDREPYKVINRGLRDAKARLGAESWRLRPYLQDFSLGMRYGEAQVRAQLAAAKAQGILGWILWNPANRYTWSVLREEIP